MSEVKRLQAARRDIGVSDLPDEILDLLPVAVCVCARDGTILRYNHAAATLWGRSPRCGDRREKFTGALRIFRGDRTALTRAQSPMAHVLAWGEELRGQRAVIERPDGTRIALRGDMDPLCDETGAVIGAVNVFREDTGQEEAGHPPASAERLHALLEAVPAAIYITDAEGRLTFYNSAAATLWGHRPELGKSEFCGSWRLFWPDGTKLPHDKCPMALALKQRRPNGGMESIAERPDGSRVRFLAYPTPLFDHSGTLIGAVNMLVNVNDLQQSELAAQRLAAIVESSNDAIVAKDLDGIITSWNEGAQRLFGYTAEEVIGGSVTILIPADRHDEEPEILARIRRGDRVDHYETVRMRKDGTLIDISLTVSPIKNAAGQIVGASKIARDITERRRAQEQQRLLLREMDHRIKNLFALASSVVTLSARTAATPAELASAVRRRLEALAQAHALTLTAPPDATAPRAEITTTLHALIRTLVSPYDGREKAACVRISGPDLPLPRGLVTSFALLLHEFATNATKYGALSTQDGYVEIDCARDGENFVLTWTEHGGLPVVEAAVGEEGFGTLLTRLTVQNQLGGEITREWKPEGLSVRLAVPLERVVV